MGAGFLLPAPPPSNSGKEEKSDKTTTATRTTTAAAAAADAASAATGRIFAVPNGFDTPGIGGSFGYCDPEAGIAYAYVMNRLWQVMIDDPREFALRSKMYQIVQEVRKNANEGENENENASSKPPLDLEKLNAPDSLSKRYMEMHPKLTPL